MTSRVIRSLRAAALMSGLVVVMGFLSMGTHAPEKPAAAPQVRATLGSSTPPETTSAPAPRSSDTLRAAVTAGQPFITVLPGEGSFTLVRAPALSWLIQRSFFWNTLPEDRGEHSVFIARETSAARDTLVLLISVE